MERTKQLVPEETEIRCQPVRRRKVVDGHVVEDAAYARIRYGNLVIGQDDGKPYYVPHQQYRNLLAKFLTSSEGQEYIIPSEQEMLEAETQVIAKYFPTKYEKAQEEDNPEPEEPVQEPENVADESEMNETPQDQEQTEPVDSSKGDEEPKGLILRFSRKKKSKRTHRRGILKGGTKDKNRAGEETEPEENSPDDEDEKGYADPVVLYDAGVPEGTVAEKFLVPETYSRRYRRMKTSAVISMAACAVLAMGLFDIIPINPSGSAEKHVIQLADDVKAGDPLTMDDFREAVIPNSQFQSASRETYIDADGNASTAYMVLWSNRTNAAGKYASTDLSAGDYLTSADYSMVKSGSDLVELSVNGSKVRIPAVLLNKGTSEMQLFAIVTSKDSDGTETTVAVPLGSAEFQGKTLRDVVDSGGKTVLDQLIAQQAGQ